MASDKVGVEPQKLEPRGGATGFADPSVQFKILQFPAKCAAKVLPAAEAQPPSAAAGSAPGLQTTSPSIVVISKATPPAASTKGQPQITKAVVSQVPSINQLTTLGRTVMITVPRSAAPQALALTPQMPQSTSSHQANLQIPPGELCGPPCVLPKTHTHALYLALARTQIELFLSIFLQE